jgi:hypothetical protein
MNYLLSISSGSEALLYHLSEVRGMCLWKHKFEPLGLNAAAIEGTKHITTRTITTSRITTRNKYYSTVYLAFAHPLAILSRQEQP